MMSQILGTCYDLNQWKMLGENKIGIFRQINPVQSFVSTIHRYSCLPIPSHLVVFTGKDIQEHPILQWSYEPQG